MMHAKTQGFKQECVPKVGLLQVKHVTQHIANSTPFNGTRKPSQSKYWRVSYLGCLPRTNWLQSAAGIVPGLPPVPPAPTSFPSLCSRHTGPAVRSTEETEEADWQGAHTQIQIHRNTHFQTHTHTHSHVLYIQYPSFSPFPLHSAD